MAKKTSATSKKNQQVVSTQHELIECDLEFPRVLQELSDLEMDELDQIEACIEKIKTMTWDQIYRTSSKTQKRGLNWEPIEGQKTKSGKTIASIRISKKFRARVSRDGKFMRFISLHPGISTNFDVKFGTLRKTDEAAAH